MNETFTFHKKCNQKVLLLISSHDFIVDICVFFQSNAFEQFSKLSVDFGSRRTTISLFQGGREETGEVG